MEVINSIKNVNEIRFLNVFIIQNFFIPFRQLICIGSSIFNMCVQKVTFNIIEKDIRNIF